tara:strand:+ start:1046 stop:1360 length:315 start_codon:yes stop_codon:yes gene_type:complete
MTNVNINGVSRKMTAEEQAEFDAQQTAWNSKSAERKLAEIRSIRNQKLSETDWLVISEQISDEQKTWRENLRKIPQDYTTENQYDLLLARNDIGKLTHTVWEKP